MEAIVDKQNIKYKTLNIGNIMIEMCCNKCMIFFNTLKAEGKQMILW